MAQLIVRNVETEVIQRLRSRAAEAGISVEEAHRRLLRQVLLGEPSRPRMNFIEYLQSMPDVELPLTREKHRARTIRF